MPISSYGNSPIVSDVAEQLDDYERFKWDVLADLVWEDYGAIRGNARKLATDPIFWREEQWSQRSIVLECGGQAALRNPTSCECTQTTMC